MIDGVFVACNIKHQKSTTYVKHQTPVATKWRQSHCVWLRKIRSLLDRMSPFDKAWEWATWHNACRIVTHDPAISDALNSLNNSETSAPGRVVRAKAYP